MEAEIPKDKCSTPLSSRRLRGLSYDVSWCSLQYNMYTRGYRVSGIRSDSDSGGQGAVENDKE